MLDSGDPYHCECLATGRMLAEHLGLAEDRFAVDLPVALRSRANGSSPTPSARSRTLGKARVKRVDVVCPGFAADCLETLEEIAIEARETFLAAGGADFRYIPCLNDRPEHIRALTTAGAGTTGGWPVLQDPWQAGRCQRRAELGARREPRAGPGRSPLVARLPGRPARRPPRFTPLSGG